ncbi:hypothetical protein BK011_09205 [Tenericutes bacterium MZ-XQ]|jgi:hypothetical protein|nr:hypothetical protein BK011_09205 [Tenericutes bacterium MZ-XQ]
MVVMMNKVYQRMLDLSDYVSKDDKVRCLLGLGSISEKERLDQYSDIDFFLIVENGYKDKFIEKLDWLEVKPLVYVFRNTKDGYKALYHDGVFAEFAVFDEEEMKTARFTGGTVYYHKDDFDLELIQPKFEPKHKTVNVDFNVNEAMTNLYIGLLRDLRGEKSSAMTFIQSYAYGLVIELFPKVFEEEKINIDPYVFERRIERRFPNQLELLKSMRQGIEHNKSSAKNILEFLNENFSVNQEFYRHINDLITI